jgi:hypothetical protein
MFERAVPRHDLELGPRSAGRQRALAGAALAPVGGERRGSRAPIERDDIIAIEIIEQYSSPVVRIWQKYGEQDVAASRESESGP